jgi:hypothetical protein
LYFLILGYSDPLTIFLSWLFRFNPIYTHLVINFFLSLTILFIYNKNLNPKWIIALALLLIFSLWLGGTKTLFIPIIIFRSLIILQLFISSANEFLLKQRINLYFPVLIFYEVTIVLKYVALGFNYSIGIYFYYLTTAFEMLICLYFIFYNLQNSPLIKVPFSFAEPE